MKSYPGSFFAAPYAPSGHLSPCTLELSVADAFPTFSLLSRLRSFVVCSSPDMVPSSADDTFPLEGVPDYRSAQVTSFFRGGRSQLGNVPPQVRLVYPHPALFLLVLFAKGFCLLRSALPLCPMVFKIAFSPNGPTPVLLFVLDIRIITMAPSIKEMSECSPVPAAESDSLTFLREHPSFRLLFCPFLGSRLRQIVSITLVGSSTRRFLSFVKELFFVFDLHLNRRVHPLRSTLFSVSFRFAA